MKVLTVEQIRAAEENAVRNGIFSYKELMYNAGIAAVKIICDKYKVIGKHIAVISGVGNNGGDGFVIANELSKIGCFVTVITPLGEPRTETAKQFFNFLPSVTVTDTLSGDYDFIIDALFGIGLDRTLSGKAAETVDFINLSSGIKIAIDLPSGVLPDGHIGGKAVNADLTVTFIALKTCLLLPPASDFCGEICVADIGAPTTDYEFLTIEQPIFKKRTRNSHKGSFGTALIVAGSYGMCGAEILATKAALRSGVGIAKAVVTDKNYTAFCSSIPEAVTYPVVADRDGGISLSFDETKSLCSNAQAVLVGPGLGQSFAAKQTTINILKNAEIPIVLDADGINAVAFDINILRKTKAPVIITPHPGEMARLCGKSVREIEADRIGNAVKFAMETGCITVLKGANTIVAAPDGRVFFNTTGNAGLATGGSGDVLSGILVSLLSQGYSPLTAALSGVYIHGKAADIAAEKYGFASLLPSDIITELKTLLD